MKDAIGIIGGMGPMASQLFYKMITEHTAADSDQEHLDLMILSDASMPDRTSAILSGAYDRVYKQLLADARLLERCGCRAVAVTCNTSHFFLDMMKDELNIPIIHMIEEAAAEAAGLYPGGRVGIMATDGTVQTGLYQKALAAQGLEPWTPPETIQREVMHQIYDRVKCGLPYDRESWQRIEGAYREAGCSCVLLACTELSVIQSDEGLSDWYMDPMAVLAKRVILFAGKKYQ